MAWTIDGNKVYVNDAKAYISAEPHTIYESGWVYFTVISKQYTGNVDIAFGFDVENVKPKKAERLNGAGWVSIADKFDSTYWDHDGFNKWYYAKNLPVTAGQTYTVRVWVDIPISTSKISGKYGFALKSSAQTLQQAKDTGNLYYLDPWYNSTFLKRQNITISTNGTSVPAWYQVKLNITYDSQMQADFDDLRFTNSSDGLLSHWIESKVNSSYANIWLNLSDAIADPGNDTVWMYYGNAAVSDSGSGNDTFIQWHGAATANYHDTNIVAVPFVWEGKARRTSDTGWFFIGTSNQQITYPPGSGDDSLSISTQNNGGLYAINHNNGVESYTSLYPPAWTLNQWYRVKIEARASNNIVYYVRDLVTSNAITTDVPDGTMGLNLYRYQGTNAEQEFAFIRKYIANEPTYTVGSPEYSLILSWNNNYTNNQNTSFTLVSNTNILFNLIPIYNDSISWFVNDINQSNSYDNLSVLIDDIGVANITAIVTNASNSQSISWLVTLSMQLITPTNGTTLYNPYPPAAPEVTFAWTSTGFPFYNLQISNDPYFNYIVSSTYHSSETANIYLLSDTKYYWKVRTYTDAYTPGEWSYVSVFNLTSNYSLSGLTGIGGIVYEKKTNGDIIPISDANVYIRNEALNWSSSQITGTNGYYLFDNLTNATVYSISAKATGYEDSQTEYVTTIPLQRVTKNILLSKCISGFNCFYNQQYVMFKVQTLFGTKYPDVTATVYKGSDLTASDTGTTGTDGSVTFLLTKDQQYRITFVSTTYGINREITIIPIKSEYIIIITALDEDWEDYSTSIKDAIFMNVSKTIIDDTHANITVSYLDLLGGTTALTVYLNQTNVSDPLNQTVVQSWTTTGNGTHNFSITPYSGQQYLVHFKAAHSTYGNLEKTYSIFFEKVAGITGIPTVALMWFAVICLVITGAIFTTSTAEFGSIIICGEAWIFLMLGFLAPLGNALAIGTALTLASVISIMSYFSMKSKREGYS